MRTLPLLITPLLLAAAMPAQRFWHFYGTGGATQAQIGPIYAPSLPFPAGGTPNNPTDPVGTPQTIAALVGPAAAAPTGAGSSLLAAAPSAGLALTPLATA